MMDHRDFGWNGSNVVAEKELAGRPRSNGSSCLVGSTAGTSAEFRANVPLSSAQLARSASVRGPRKVQEPRAGFDPDVLMPDSAREATSGSYGGSSRSFRRPSLVGR